MSWVDGIVESTTIKGTARGAAMLLVPVCFWFGQRQIDRQDAFEKTLIELTQHQAVQDATIVSDRKTTTSLFESVSGRVDILSGRITDLAHTLHDDYALKSDLRSGIEYEDRGVVELQRRVGVLEGRGDGRDKK